MPKVSVIIPVYNHERFIAECIDSVLQQTYTNYEIIVVDDGSTDRTPQILRAYAPHITCIRQENKGVAEALNAAMRNSSGAYIAWLSSDDLFLPTKLEEQIRYFESHTGVDLVYTDYYTIDEKGEITAESHLPHYADKKRLLYELMLENFINGCSVMFARKCLDTIQGFDPKMGYASDCDAWLRMLKHHAFGHIPKALVKYRWHQSNVSYNLAWVRYYARIQYEKSFRLYALEDLCPSGVDPCDVHLDLAAVFCRRWGFYLMAFGQLMRAIALRPAHPRIYERLLKLLWRFMLDVPRNRTLDAVRRGKFNTCTAYSIPFQTHL